jgi:hypothetical protein
MPERWYDTSSIPRTHEYRDDCTRISQMGDLAPRICAPLFITVLTGAIPEPNKSIPQPYIHVYIFQAVSFLHISPCNSLSSYIHITFPAQLLFLDFITLLTFGGTINLSSLFCNILHHLHTSSPPGPNIFHSTLFSNPLNLCSSPSVTYQVLHRHETDKNIVLL